MKTLNEYGLGVMSAQSSVEAVKTQIESAESALDSLRSDLALAEAGLKEARQALSDATERVLSGDYGSDVAAQAEAILNDDPPFEGLNRAPPDDEPDFTLGENRSLAGNGAGF